MLHKDIKDQIKTAMRAKDTVRLDTLRGLNALFMNDLIAEKSNAEFVTDEKALSLIKRSVKQHKDSIEQFTKGNRNDLVEIEQAELKILEAFLPAMMSRAEIKVVAHTRIETLKSQGTFDPKSAGKITGMIMKKLAGKADGADVKAVVEELMG